MASDLHGSVQLLQPTDLLTPRESAPRRRSGVPPCRSRNSNGGRMANAIVGEMRGCRSKRTGGRSCLVARPGPEARAPGSRSLGEGVNRGIPNRTVSHARGPWLLAVEPPARSSVGLHGRDAERGVEHAAVEVPGRRPGARRAVGHREPVALDLRRRRSPAAGARPCTRGWPRDYAPYASPDP